MKKKLLLTALLIGLSFTYTVPTYAMTQDEAIEWIRQNYGDEYIEENRGKSGAHPELSKATNNTTQSTSSNMGASTQTSVEVEVHKHEYTSKITNDATCTEVGVETFTCDCGDSYTESIEMIEHDYSKETVAKEATCKEVGEKKITCSMCDDFITEEIPATGHKEGSF